MAHINCGVWTNARRVKTKKELKELVSRAMENGGIGIEFDSTEMYTSGQRFGFNDWPEGTKASVVGPDPYNDRRWHATIEYVNGKAKVS